MDAINKFWTYSYTHSYSGSRGNGVLLGSFQNYLEFCLEGNTIEVPAFAKRMAVRARIVDGCKNLLIPLVANTGLIERRQAARMLKDFYDQRGICQLRGVISSKGDKYYGMPGFICDDRMNILFLSTCVIDIEDFSHKGWVTQVNIYMDYKMLENTDRILEKTFLRQYIPHIRQMEIDPVDLIEGTEVDGDPEMKRYPTVIIDDLTTKFLKNPIPPVPGENFDKVINNNFRKAINEL